MLRSSLISLKATEAQARASSNPARKRGDGWAGPEAAAVHADINLYQRGEPASRDLGGSLERCDASPGIDADRRCRDAAQGRKAGELAGAGRLVANENVTDPAPGKNLGFRDLLHALADRAALDLQPGD